jgi:hypothetical protein
MRDVIVLIFLIALQTVPSKEMAQDAIQPGHEARPLVVMLSRDPWLTVIGSDSPIFALYDDVTVIYFRRTERRKGEYRSARLSGKQKTELIAKLKLPELQFLQTRRFRASEATDQPQNELNVFVDGRLDAIHVYGNLDEVDAKPDQDGFRIVQKEKIPSAFLSAYQVLTSFDPPDTRLWVPEKIELMLWDFGYAKQTVPWPESWPKLESPEATQRGDMYSIYIPGSQLDEVKEFISERAAEAAVELGGRKWAVSFRRPFPQEKLWMTSDGQEEEDGRDSTPATRPGK